MKLLAVLSFALALVATVIAAPVEDVVPVLATALPATADGDGDFYPFSISLIQDCINGAKKTTGTIHFDWISYSVDLQFDAKAMHFFDFPGGKQLKITWDERNCECHVRVEENMELTEINSLRQLRLGFLRLGHGSAETMRLVHQEAELVECTDRLCY
jgi:hypothetical protein